jgi:putative oxidoreductase
MTLWTVVMWAGRLLCAGFFLMSAYNHLTKSAMLAGYAQSKGVPMAQVSTIVTGLIMLAGALSVLTGWHVTYGVGLLILFLVPTAFIMHNYWAVADPMGKMNDRINFWKNITIAAALMLYVSALHRAY